MNLLHCVSESAGKSLMDSSNLAIVLSPNIMRPHIDIITAIQGNPLKNQAGEYLTWAAIMTGNKNSYSGTPL